VPEASTTRTTHTRHVRTVLAWFGGNLVLGYLLSFPLITVILLGDYFRARVWHTTVAPFHGAEAQMGVLFVVAVGGPLGTAAILLNRAVRRRLVLRRWTAPVFSPFTAVILMSPFAAFYIAEPTVPQMLGKGLLW
jgi:hypothetical protein